MDSILKWSGVVALVILAIIFVPKLFVSQSLGGTTNYDTVSASALQIGSGCNSSYGVCVGTLASGINFGSCQLDAESATLAAFQTKTIDCGGGTEGETALTGITAGDTVFLHLATTTPTTLNSVLITAVNASSTAGFITASITNASSSAVTLTASATTSLQYWVVR